MACGASRRLVAGGAIAPLVEQRYRAARRFGIAGGLGVVLDACCTSSYIRFCFYLGSLRSRYYENIIQMALVLQVALGWFWMVSPKGFTFWFL